MVRIKKIIALLLCLVLVGIIGCNTVEDEKSEVNTTISGDNEARLEEERKQLEWEKKLLEEAFWGGKDIFLSYQKN